MLPRCVSGSRLGPLTQRQPLQSTSTDWAAKIIKKLNGAALAIGDIAGSGHVCDCVYNGTDVILLNFAPVAVDREQNFSAKQIFSKPVITTMTTLADAATIAWDMNATSNDVRIVLTASRNLGLPTNMNTGQKGLLVVQQDGTGGWGLNLNAIFKTLSYIDIEKGAICEDYLCLSSCRGSHLHQSDPAQVYVDRGKIQYWILSRVKSWFVCPRHIFSNTAQSGAATISGALGITLYDR